MTSDKHDLGTASSTTAPNVSNYAEERALIRDLQVHCLSALDAEDAEQYASLFTEDGIVSVFRQEFQGREAIRKLVARIKVDDQPDIKRRPVTMRHCISNIALKIDGNKAIGRFYWFRMSNKNPERSAMLDSYSHYEAEMVKVDGKWLFSKRLIYDEVFDRGAAEANNPCW